MLLWLFIIIDILEAGLSRILHGIMDIVISCYFIKDPFLEKFEIVQSTSFPGNFCLQ